MPSFSDDPFQYLRRQSRRGAMRSFVPADLDTLLIDAWDAESSASLTLVGSNVSQWSSIKGATPAVQATDANRPVYSATSFNGRPGLTFDGVNDSLTSTGVGLLPTGASPGEIWVLADQTTLVADTATRFLLAYGANGAFQRQVLRSVISGANVAQGGYGDGTTQVVSPASGDFSGKSVVRTIFGAASVGASLNGGSVNTVAVTPNTGTERIRFGARANTAASAYSQMVLAGVWFTGPLSDAQTAQMTAYLKDRGGIA